MKGYNNEKPNLHVKRDFTIMKWNFPWFLWRIPHQEAMEKGEMLMLKVKEVSQRHFDHEQRTESHRHPWSRRPPLQIFPGSLAKWGQEENLGVLEHVAHCFLEVVHFHDVEILREIFKVIKSQSQCSKSMASHKAGSVFQQAPANTVDIDDPWKGSFSYRGGNDRAKSSHNAKNVFLFWKPF